MSNSRKSQGAAKRPYDIVVWGVGYTGLLVAKHLASAYPQGPSSSIRFALAGRSLVKLEAARAECAKIDEGCANLALLIGDAKDQNSLEEIAKQTRVILSCAGPYALLGDALVAACVKCKTDYCDITGEYTWVKSLIDRHHAEAEAAGVLIVNSCGFDSVPSDLGALFTVQAARTMYPQATITNVDAAVSGQGGVSGGTVASILNLLESSTSAQLKESMDPFYLNPQPHTNKATAHDGDMMLPAWNQSINAYLAPYIMAPGNVRCVRRSAALLNFGPCFSYREGYHAKNLLIALIVIIAHIVLLLPLMLSFTRNLLKKYVLPAPGSGPSEHTRRTGWFRVKFAAECLDADGSKHVVKTQVSGGEPGYHETSKMLAEAAVCMVLQRDTLRAKGGVLTPAAAMGPVLIKRLQDVGIKFEVLDK